MSARTALVTGDSGSFSRARRRTGANPNRPSAPRKNQHSSRGPTTRRATTHPRNQHQNDRSTTGHDPLRTLQIRDLPSPQTILHIRYLCPRSPFANPSPTQTPAPHPSRLANPSLMQRHVIMRGTRAYAERLRPLERDQESNRRRGRGRAALFSRRRSVVGPVGAQHRLRGQWQEPRIYPPRHRSKKVQSILIPCAPAHYSAEAQSLSSPRRHCGRQAGICNAFAAAQHR